jgi:hypothetical protein
MEERKAAVIRYPNDHQNELLEFTPHLIGTPSRTPPVIQADAAVLGEPSGIHTEWILTYPVGDLRKAEIQMFPTNEKQ